MKIISKFKDYYDYLVGIYGMDDKIVYERNQSSGIDIYDGHLYSLWICDEQYYGIGKYKIISWNIDDLINHKDDFEFTCWLYKKIQLKKNDNTINYFRWKYFNKGEPKKVNTKENCPIILGGENGIRNPNLSSINFKEITPHDMWIKLTEWFSPKDIQMDKPPTDMNRFESKGFHKKTSFRKIK